MRTYFNRQTSEICRLCLSSCKPFPEANWVVLPKKMGLRLDECNERILEWVYLSLCYYVFDPADEIDLLCEFKDEIAEYFDHLEYQMELTKGFP